MNTFFNIKFEADKNDIIRLISFRCKKGSGYVCVVDGNILSIVHNDFSYRNVVNGALFSIPDSSWIPLFVKWIYGKKIQQYCGSDIFKDLTESKNYRHYFLGSTPNILMALKGQLSSIDLMFENMQFECLPFADVDCFDYSAISEKINSDAPDIVWLSLGAPKQEIFASRLAPLLKKGIIIPVGAVFNFRSGISYSRAPRWMINMHLEFIYRIFTEPLKQINRCCYIIKTLPSILLEEKRKKKKM